MATSTYLVDANGEVLEFADPQQAQYALDGGLAPASEEQAAAFQKRDALLRENSTLGAQVRGEVEGVLRGGSLGAFDPLAVALGADAEGMATRRDLSSGVGEFVGAALPVALSGGTGALGSAARLAPTAVLSGVSERAGAAVAKRLFGEAVEAGALKTMARGAVQGGVTEVVEGIPYGASELLTEASIGDEELSAEKVAGHLGLSAVLGGALGAGFGGGAAGIGVALKKAGESLGGLRDRFVREYPGYIAPRAGTTPEMVEYAMGRRVDLDKGASMKEIVADKIPAPAVPVADVMQGPIPPIPEPKPLPPKFEKREFVPTEAPPAPFVPDAVPAEAVFGGVTPTVLGKAPKAQYAQDFRKSVDAVMTDMEDLSKRAQMEMRDAELAPLVNANTPVETAQQAAFDLSKAIKEVEQQGVLNGPDRFNAGARKNLEEIHAGLVFNIGQEGVTAYDVFRTVDEAKRRMWDEVIGPLGSGSGADRLRAKETVDAVRSLWGQARDLTQNTSLWGEAAARHADMNAKAHAWMVARDNFLPKVTSQVKGTASEDGLRRGSKKVKQGATKKAESFLSNPAPEDLVVMRQMLDAAAQYRDAIEARAVAAKADMNRLFGDEALANIAKTVEAEQALKGFRAEQTGKAQLAKEAKAAFKERQAIAEQVFEREEALRRKAVARERELAKKASEQEIEQAKLKVASFKADIDAGEADYATRRKEYDELSALRKAEIKAQDKALRAAAKWNGLTDTVGAMISVQAPLLAPLFVGYRAMKYMGSPDKAIRTLAMLERYAETISKAIDTSADLLVRGKVAQAGRVIGQLSLNHELLRQWSNDPETLVEKLNEQTEGVASDMPRLANGVQMTTARAAQYLATKLPPKDVTPFAEDDREPSDAELAPFRTALSVIESPVLLMQLASTGQLTTDHVEAVQAVYPALLQDMRVRTMEALARAGTKPPFAVRQSLSILLGQDLDGSMAQLASNQAVYAAGGADKPAPPRRPSSRESTPSTADNYRPPSQRMESP